MTADLHHIDIQHEPAPPEPRRLIPERGMLVRGLGLGVLTLALGVATVKAFGADWWMTPVWLATGAGAVLSAWGSLIHLTGGERFDDHPWV